MAIDLGGCAVPPPAAAFLDAWLAAGSPALLLSDPPQQWDGTKWVPLTFLRPVGDLSPRGCALPPEPDVTVEGR